MNFGVISGSILSSRAKLRYYLSKRNTIRGFQCIVTNTHPDRSIDLFPINGFHYDASNDFRYENDKQDVIERR